MRFEQLNYSENPVVKESVLQYIEVPKQTRIQTLLIKQAQLQRQDSLFLALSEYTEVEENCFSLEYSTVQTQAEYYTRAGFDIRLDLDVTLIERNVYNILMLLGDVGGLMGVIYSISASILSLVTFQNAENFIAKSLYLSKNSTVDPIGKSDSKS